MPRRQRRARTPSLPKPPALYPTFPTFLPSTPLQQANTQITQIPNRRQARKDRPCTPHLASPPHPLPHFLPPRPTPSKGLRSHHRHQTPQAHRLFPHRPLPFLILPTLRRARRATVLKNPGQGRRHRQHLIRILFRHTLTDKYAPSHHAPLTPGSAFVTSDRRSTRNSTTPSFQG